VTPDMLQKLDDAALQAVIAQAEGLLKQRDEERKAKALEQARAILEEAGLKLKDVATGKPHKNGKGQVYHGGHRYQHPDDESLTWGGKGKKPRWLLILESAGRRAVELD
jgi:DNA-binding protein H-NS